MAIPQLAFASTWCLFYVLGACLAAGTWRPSSTGSSSPTGSWWSSPSATCWAPRTTRGAASPRSGASRTPTSSPPCTSRQVSHALMPRVAALSRTQQRRPRPPRKQKTGGALSLPVRVRLRAATPAAELYARQQRAKRNYRERTSTFWIVYETIIGVLMLAALVLLYFYVFVLSPEAPVQAEFDVYDAGQSPRVRHPLHAHSLTHAPFTLVVTWHARLLTQTPQTPTRRRTSSCCKRTRAATARRRSSRPCPRRRTTPAGRRWAARRAAWRP